MEQTEIPVPSQPAPKAEFPSRWGDDSVFCPWCDAECDDIEIDDDGGEVDCSECGRRFSYSVEVTRSFDTEGMAGGSKTDEKGNKVELKTLACKACLYLPKGGGVCPLKKEEVTEDSRVCTIEVRGKKGGKK